MENECKLNDMENYEKYKKDIEYIDKEIYYTCFSWRVKEFLKEKKIYYDYKDKHIKTGCVFYVYEKSDRLDRTLKEYSRLKEEWKKKM